MINIQKINNPKYLFKHSTHEYMTEGDNEVGVFAGRGSKFLKLEGKVVEQDKFEYLISKGGPDNMGVEIDPGAPKDWSILYNRVSDEDRAKMDIGFTQALHDVAKAIEENTYYRKTVDGKESYHLARGVTMAIFQHHTARSVGDKGIDPHEHGHIVVFPKVMGDGGKMYSHTLFDLIHEKDGQGNSQETLKYFDQVMQYSLAKFLTNEMGHTLSRGVADSFKIDGITDEMRKEFSKRTESIKEVAREDATYEEKKKISLKQRNTKTENDLPELRKGWQEKMSSSGLKEEDIAKMKGKQENLDRPFDEVFDKSTIISNKKLKMMALSEAKFSNKTAEEKLAEFKASKSLVKVGRNQNLNAKTSSLRKLAHDYNTHKIDAVKAKASGKAPKPKKTTSPGIEPVKNTLIKTDKSSKVKQSDRIVMQINDLSNSHSLRMLQITTSSNTKPAKEGQLIAKEVANFNEEHSKLMFEYNNAIQNENNKGFDI